MAEPQTTEAGTVPTIPAIPVDPSRSDTNYSNHEMMHMVQYMAKAMQRNTHLRMLSKLPPDVRRRLRALRNLQLQTNAVEMEFHEKEFELEKEFQVKHQEIFKKRFEIIRGEYEPNDNECDYPDPDMLQRVDENLSIFTKLCEKDESLDKTEPIKGVPNFWSHILYSNSMLDFIIHTGDEAILEHLIDIRTKYQSEPHFSFILEFEFSPNPYFENSILTKEYLLKMKFDDVLSYEGPEIYKTIGCDINWKTDRTSNQAPSFLDFFSPAVLPEDPVDSSYKDIKDLLENDFEIGNYIKDHIVPKATLYYTGEFNDYYEDSIESETIDGDSVDQLDLQEEGEVEQQVKLETGGQ